MSAVHHHLISVGKRVQTALIVESGEIRKVMHAALLLSFGASALNPYMAFAVIDKLVNEKGNTARLRHCRKVYQVRLQRLVQDYEQDGHQHHPFLPGRENFRGRRTERVEQCLLWRLSSRIGGIRLDEVARDAIAFHKEGMEVPKKEGGSGAIAELPRMNAFRKDGEKHAWNPETISTLQLATHAWEAIRNSRSSLPW